MDYLLMLTYPPDGGEKGEYPIGIQKSNWTLIAEDEGKDRHGEIVWSFCVLQHKDGRRIVHGVTWMENPLDHCPKHSYGEVVHPTSKGTPDEERTLTVIREMGVQLAGTIAANRIRHQIALRKAIPYE